MKLPLALSLCIVVSVAASGADEAGWAVILDAATFKDWKVAPEDGANRVVDQEGVKEVHKPDGTVLGRWTFADGVLSGEGGVSHIFSPRGDYTDFRFSADIWIGDNSNSGMYFRTAFGNGWPDGYEAQINDNFGDPTKSGSLYGIVNLAKAPVPAKTWYTQEVLAEGEHIVISIDGKVVVDTTHAQRKTGHVAFQQHHQGSEVKIRNVRIMELGAAQAE
ncbi:MAG TPA: DUF1080 domain-containing protein [Planctomycetota bacterium]|nr:DUF1080 domain-containing protein [Planctomycetota bacterium]